MALPGKRVGGALYLHRTATGYLPPSEASRLRAAVDLAGIDRWNVAKIDLKGGAKVSLLLYEDFDAVAFPALVESHRVDLGAGSVDVRRYRENPPILHRKELLLAPDDPRREVFGALTGELDRLGLFVDMARRGRKGAWEAALASAGVVVTGHDVDVVEGPDEGPEPPADDAWEPGTVARHRTAIGRNSLSAPMAALNAAGLLEDRVTILDYGCGRGDDVRALQAAGIDAVGWDPHYAPDRGVLAPRGIVNLGFVLNVVEDPEERREVLRAAYDLAERCLVVAVMLVGKGDVSGLRPHGDGVLTSRGTFQRYYMQAEIRAFLAETLDVTPVAAAPGIHFLFRDEEMEQAFLSRRQTGVGGPRPIPAMPRPPVVGGARTRAREAALREVRDDLARLVLQLGRVPHPTEIPPDLKAALSDGRLSLQAALAAVVPEISQEDRDAAMARRRDEVGRFFALSAFTGRSAYRRLAPMLQRDVRAFFGSLGAAEAAGRRMLFDAGDAEALARDAQDHAAAGVGYLAGDKFLVHARDLERLSPRLRTYVGIGETLAGSLESATLYRIHLISRKLTALTYPDFETRAIPRLSERIKIDLRTGDVDIFDHDTKGRVSVLLCKSRFMSGAEDRYSEQVAFDREVVRAVGDDVDAVPFAVAADAMLKAGLRPPY